MDNILGNFKKKFKILIFIVFVERFVLSNPPDGKGSNSSKSVRKQSMYIVILVVPCLRLSSLCAKPGMICLKT